MKIENLVEAVTSEVNTWVAIVCESQQDQNRIRKMMLRRGITSIVQSRDHWTENCFMQFPIIGVSRVNELIFGNYSDFQFEYARKITAKEFINSNICK